MWVNVKLLQYEKIDASEGIDVNKTSPLKECEICNYWFFKGVGFKFEEHVCNRCHDLLTMAHSLKNIGYWAQHLLLLDVYRCVLVKMKR